jgi:hypothetical protein
MIVPGKEPDCKSYMSLKNRYMPVVPTTQQAKAEGTLEPKTLGSLYNIVRSCVCVGGVLLGLELWAFTLSHSTSPIFL